MNDVLNRFRLGVIAERQFAATITSNGLFGREQWHARCEHLAERAGNDPETYGRLSVAFSILEALDSDADGAQR